MLDASQWDSAAGESSVRVGLVPTESGVGDLSFNGMAYQGLVRAVSDLGVDGSVYTPTGPLDYGSMLQQCVDDGNQLCIAVGFSMANVLLESIGGLSITAHILGGCPMGDSAESGVVGTDHQVFGYPGLYIVDGSAVSANVGVNPALIIVALAERCMSLVPERRQDDPAPAP